MQIQASCHEVGLDFNKLSKDPKISPEDLKAKLSESQILKALAKSISQELKHADYLAIRSSGLGDGAGIGIYESEYCKNTAESILKSVCNVLTSYFSDAATQFRARTKLSAGFAISVEALIGNNDKYPNPDYP